MAKPTKLLRENTDHKRCTIYNAGTSTARAAIEEAECEIDIRNIEDREQWRPTSGQTEWMCTSNKVDESEWFIMHDDGRSPPAKSQQAIEITNPRAIIIFTSTKIKGARQRVKSRIEILHNKRMQCTNRKMIATEYCAAIANSFYVTIAHKVPGIVEKMRMQPTPWTSMTTEMDRPNSTNGDDYIIGVREERTLQRGDQMCEPAKVYKMIKIGKDWIPSFDQQGPAPNLHHAQTRWWDSPFAMYDTENLTQGAEWNNRAIRPLELARLNGLDEQSLLAMAQVEHHVCMNEVANTPPKQLINAVLSALIEAEKTDKIKIMIGITGEEMQAAPTLPLPTKEAWTQATEQDPDLGAIKQALTNNTPLQVEDLQEKEWHREWKRNRLETEDGVVYRCEAGRHEGMRVIRATAVPRPFRQTMFSAFHVSPMGGHTGYHKTHNKIAARFYWPGMTRDIRQKTLGCAHCRVVNITSHEERQELTSFDITSLFDIIAMDAWNPGACTTIKSKTTHVLCALDFMTSFAMGAFLDNLSAEHMTVTTFTMFFAQTGLPRLIIIDAGSEFAGVLKQMCASLGLNYYAVSKGNHKAVLVERFNRYMNKTQKLHSANCETFYEWKLGTAFAFYGWNSSPIDGTNIIRSYAAMGREFPFPIDFNMEPTTNPNPHNQAQAAMEHLEATFPMLHKQRKLLQILNEERRQHHRNLKNEGKTTTEFRAGDIVLIRKQVQSKPNKRPAKSQISARGPCRVINKIKPGSYNKQKLPFEAGHKRPGRPYKESAARMERLPSTMTVHRMTQGADMRCAALNRPHVTNPLEGVLGAYRFGACVQAGEDQPFAFVKIQDIWSDDESQGENSDTDDSDANGDANGQQNQPADPDIDASDSSTENEGDDSHKDSSDNNNSDNNSSDNDSNKSDEKEEKLNKQIGNKKRRSPNHANEGATTAPKKRPRRSHRRPAGLPNKYQYAGIETNLKATPLSREQQTEQLLAEIKISRNKLFFIRFKDFPTAPTEWKIGQVLFEKSTNETDIEEGQCYLRLLTRHADDSKRYSIRACRYWPQVNKANTDGSIGPQVYIRPGKINNLLTSKRHNYRAKEVKINLYDQMVHGPFNFGHPAKYNNKGEIIPDEVWTEVIAKANKYQLDLSQIDRVVPMRLA